MRVEGQNEVWPPRSNTCRLSLHVLPCWFINSTDVCIEGMVTPINHLLQAWTSSQVFTMAIAHCSWPTWDHQVIETVFTSSWLLWVFEVWRGLILHHILYKTDVFELNCKSISTCTFIWSDKTWSAPCVGPIAWSKKVYQTDPQELSPAV